MSNKAIVEQQKRFSESYLWELQREYFDKSGIDAWVDQVPFYVTSNPFIANCYADLVLKMARDCIKNNPEAAKHPFYIMELGTGSGRFSFYVLKKLRELCQQLKLEHIRFCYIMSDFTQSNIKYWETHPALQIFLKEGMLDFAIYDMENDDPIHLIKQNLTLTPEHFFNPLTIFGNYIFDTVSQDAFLAKDGKLNELLISLTTSESNMRDNKPIDWEQVTVDFTPKPIDENYYPDAEYNAILAEYKTGVKSSNFLFPLGGLRAIKKLKKLANNKLFLVSSDKGYADMPSMENLGHPQLAFHGSFSMMVNFHVIARYFHYCGGDYYLQSNRKGIKTVVCSLGFKFADMPETSLGIQQHVEGLSPADYFILHRRISESYHDCNLETLASHLQLAGWDPHIYMRISGRIASLLSESDSSTIEYLANNMMKILDNYHYMPKAPNVFFEVGIFYHSLKRYQDALNCYLKAVEIYGEQFSLIYNAALCFYYAGEAEKALGYFKRSLQLDSHSKEAREWVEYVENTIT